MTEYLMVVDENNHPLLKRLTKKHVHEEGLWHRTNHIWVLNNKNQLLLVKRREWKRQDPGKWASYIGGHLLYGESIIQGAIRETEEEIDLQIKARRFSPIRLKKSQAAKEYAQIYTLKLRREEKIAPTKKEFADHRFIELSLKAIKPINAKNLSGGLKYFKYQLKTLKGSRKNLEEG